MNAIKFTRRFDQLMRILEERPVGKYTSEQLMWINQLMVDKSWLRLGRNAQLLSDMERLVGQLDRRAECPEQHGEQCCNEPDVCRAALKKERRNA